MLSAILALSIGGQVLSNSQDQAVQWKPMFNQVILQPTGDNGYEEYVRAIDTIRNPQVWSFSAYEEYVRKLHHEKDEDVPVYPPGVTPEMTLLEVQREHVRRCASAINLIERGNDKGVFEPRASIGPATIFPEYADFKSIARFAAVDMRVCFADGQSDRATAIASAVLTMRSKLPPTFLIVELVGISMDSILLSAINDNTDRFSERDWTRLQRLAEQRLASNTLPQVLNGEMRFELSALSLMGKPDFDPLFLADDHRDDISKYFASLSPAQQRSVVDRVKQEIASKFEQLDNRLKGPERAWIQPAEEAAAFHPTPDSLAVTIVDLLTPTFDGVLQAEIRNRTQLRLLKLHAEIQRYRWHHDRLPEKLEDVVGKEAIDPLTDEAYIYQPLSLTSYKLASKGIKETGEIQLRYVRPPNLGKDDGGP